MDLKEALSKLDHDNDEHWTADGMPMVALVSRLLGQEVSRQDIINTAPEFSRGFDFEDSGEQEKDEQLLDEGESLEQLAEYDRVIAGYQGEAKKLQTKIREIGFLRAQLSAQRNNEFNHQVDQDRRMAHIKSQNAQRMKKHEARVAALKGVDLKSLQAISPIDAAMSMKKNQAPRRPERLLRESSE